MPGRPTSGSRAPSPWWVLCLLPVGLAAGWLVGQAPTPKPPATSTGSNSNASVTATRPGPERIRVAGATIMKADDPRADPAPTSAGGATAPDQDVEVSQWTTLDNAIIESKRNGKPILIDFSAEWCPPCQAMRRELFDEPAHGLRVQREVIPVSIVDQVREEGRNSDETDELQRRFDVNGFPTLIVFSPQSGRSMKTQGFGNADRTLAWITEATRAVR